MRIIYPRSLTTNEVVSLTCWWCLSNQYGLEGANAVYDKITVRGWAEEEEGVSHMLSKTYGQTAILPRAGIAQILGSVPYEIRTDASTRRAYGFRIIDGSVTEL